MKNAGEKMLTHIKPTLVLCLLLSTAASPAEAQRRLVLIDQDGSGPADSNQMSMMVLLQAPQVEVLGITIVTGNAWRDVEVQHTLRMLELIGRSDVPVVPGAVFPLVRTQEETRLSMQTNGTPVWVGAWGGLTTDLPAPAGGVVAPVAVHGPWEIPPLPEGSPRAQPLAEDAAHFLIRQVRAHPGEVTIYAAGPLTNIALAVAIDPKFAELTRGIVIMGSSLNPQTDDPEFATSPRHEFKLADASRD
jgi:inosine-uridine nucleoside N-ribohydrolase